MPRLILQAIQAKQKQDFQQITVLEKQKWLVFSSFCVFSLRTTWNMQGIQMFSTFK